MHTPHAASHDETRNHETVDDDIWLVSLHALRELCGDTVFDYNPWGCQPPITAQEVHCALQRNILEPTPFSTENSPQFWNRDQHIARIAYLVANQDPHPIDIDVGVPELGCHVSWPVQDGNHRGAAAILRQDSHITCTLAGSTAVLANLHPICATDPSIAFETP